MLDALSLLSTPALNIRRLRELLDPSEVVRGMTAAGAQPGDLASQAVAAALLAPEIDDLIRPDALPNLPGMVDDVAALVVEALDGPAAALALWGIYRRAVRQGVSVAPPVAPERPRLPLQDVRALVREGAALRRPSREALNPATSDAGVQPDPTTEPATAGTDPA